MMPQFGEMQYSLAANFQLTSRENLPFIPTQPHECYLGFDSAAQWRPDESGEISLLGQPTPGIPLQTLASAGQADLSRGLPPLIASLFLQFKVAERRAGRTGKMMRRFRRPYYSIKLENSQAQALQRLEAQVGQLAIVRYAAPRFSTFPELFAAHQNREVLQRSAFLTPSKLGPHTRWYFSEDEPMTSILNPEPEQVESEDLGSIERAGRQIATRIPIEQHVVKLAQALGVAGIDSATEDGWRQAIVSVSARAARAHATWVILRWSSRPIESTLRETVDRAFFPLDGDTGSGT